MNNSTKVSARAVAIRSNPHARQFVKYAIVGISSTIINFIVYGLLLLIGVHYLVAAVAAFAVATLNGYTLNSLWTYHGGSHTNTRMVKFTAIQLSGLMINLLVLLFLVETVELNKLLAQLFANACVVASTFGGNKFWTFRV